MSASTVCGVGSTMSSTRLCVRISNCSRLFLSTCGERFTVNFSIRVGSGIGPRISAPVRLAVSAISPVAWSRTLWSNAFRRIRIFCVSIAAYITNKKKEPIHPMAGTTGGRKSRAARNHEGIGRPRVSILLRDRGHNPCTDRAAAFADGEAQTLVHGDRGNQLDAELHI